MGQENKPAKVKTMNAKLKVVKGEFIRSESGFRNWVTSDGSSGPSGEGGFPASLTAITFTYPMPAPGHIAR